MSDHSRDEVEGHFQCWREAIDRRDIEAMASMFSDDARGGNSQFGLFEGRDAIMRFTMDRWPASVPNKSVWHVIDDLRVVNKWRETLPGEAPDGSDYHYFGISEFIYAGSSQWNFMYGIPDVIGLTRVHARWLKDGQADRFGEVYPGLA